MLWGGPYGCLDEVAPLAATLFRNSRSRGSAAKLSPLPPPPAHRNWSVPNRRPQTRARRWSRPSSRQAATSGRPRAVVPPPRARACNHRMLVPAYGQPPCSMVVYAAWMLYWARMSAPAPGMHGLLSHAAPLPRTPPPLLPLMQVCTANMAAEQAAAQASCDRDQLAATQVGALRGICRGGVPHHPFMQRTAHRAARVGAPCLPCARART